MASAGFDRLLTAIARRQHTVWAVFLVGILGHTAQLVIVALTSQPREPALAVGLHLSLLVVTGGPTLAFLVLRRMLFDEQRVARRLASYDLGPATMPGVDADDVAEDLASLGEAERGALALAWWTTAQLVVLWAVANSIAVMGVIAGNVAANFERAIPYLIVATLLTRVTPPRPRHLVRTALAARAAS